MSTQHTDGRLIVRVRDGDLDALGELYERHKMRVYRTAMAITHDERAAEDILQDVFLRVHTYAGTIDETMPLSPWLYRVTVNLSYSWAKRVKRWLYSLHDTLDRWVSSTTIHPEAVVDERERRQGLQQAIDTLPLNQRVVIVLHYLEGLSLREIAYVMGIPEGTVKSRLHYARENLRKVLRERERMLVPEMAYDFT